MITREHINVISQPSEDPKGVRYACGLFLRSEFFISEKFIQQNEEQSQKLIDEEVERQIRNIESQLYGDVVKAINVLRARVLRVVCNTGPIGHRDCSGISDAFSEIIGMMRLSSSKSEIEPECENDVAP